jgi:hypothetical protein
VPLVDLHRQMIEAIGWISPTMGDSILLVDQFPETHRNGRAKIEADLKAYVNNP